MIKALRRTYFIYPEIQKPLIRQIIIGLSLLSIFQLGCIYLSMLWLEKVTMANISLVVDFRVLASWKTLLYASVIAPLAINLIVNVMIILYVSNKFAGPLFRLEKEIDLYLSGDKKELSINFRKYDYLHKLSEKINQLHKKMAG